MTFSPAQTYKELEPIFTQYLVANHHRRTQERYAVLQAICNTQLAFDAEQIYQQLQKDFPVSLATVYNTLSILEKCHIIHCLQHQFGQARTKYERTKRQGTHMQFVCTKCGREQEFYDKNITNAIAMHKYNNFNLTNYSLYVYGTCKYCRRAGEKK